MFGIETLNKIFLDAMIGIPDGDIGVGVSGGGDSLALLLLSAEWAQNTNRSLKAVTIDHGLRSGSSLECDHVKRISDGLSIQHTTLKWLAEPVGNLQNAARNARHELLLEWTYKQKLSVVLLGHTLDDNAETVIIKLIRGSGIDGLAGIEKSKNINGLNIYRPLINIPREDLRAYLQAKKVGWIDEPSNFDERFERIKVRNFLPSLSHVGLTPKKLVKLASHMSRAKEALTCQVSNFARQHVEQTIWGDLAINLDEFIKIPREYQFRLLSSGLRWISGKVYKPRFQSLERLLNAITSQKLGKSMSLMGCIIKYDRNWLKLSREFSAISKPSVAMKPNFVWEKKWQIEVDLEKLNVATVGPVGKNGLEQLEGYNRINVPQTALICSVAMFENKNLLCVPIVSYGSGLKCYMIGGDKSFLKFL
jgi:tRNA(Ile)-lysidine synthase